MLKKEIFKYIRKSTQKDSHNRNGKTWSRIEVDDVVGHAKIPIWLQDTPFQRCVYAIN